MPKQTFYQLSQSRQNNIDVLRFSLAALVIYSHAYPMLGLNNSEPIRNLTHAQMPGGTMAVDLFFVLSGFLIANSWIHSRNLKDYLKRRCLRIYPGFVAALLFCVLIVGPLCCVNLVHYIHQRDVLQFIYRPLLFRDVYGVQGVFSHNAWPGSLNGSLWTIRWELFCYIFVALGGLLGAYRKRRIVLLVFLATLAFYNFSHMSLSVPYFDLLEELPRFLTYFLAGMTFYFYRDMIPYSRGLALLSIIGLAFSLKHNLAITFPICGTYLVLFVAFTKSIRLQNFGKHGDFSYGIYLYAFPVQQMLIYFLPNRLNPITLFLLAFLVTLILAIGSWHFIEKPFLKLKSSNLVASTAKYSDTARGVEEAGLTEPSMTMAVVSHRESVNSRK